MPREKSSVSDYNDVRQLLKNIYLYGFLSREDFVGLKICSANQYDANTKLLRDIMPTIENSAVWNGNKKNLRMAREFTRSSEQQLARSYSLHGINQNELTNILWILSASQNSQSQAALLSEIIYQASDDEFEDEFEDESADKTYRKSDYSAKSPSTISRLCKSLVNFGYIEVEKPKRHTPTRNRPEDDDRRERSQQLIKLQESLLFTLSNAELVELYRYTDFMCEVTYPRVAGTFLLRSIHREMIRRKTDNPNEWPEPKNKLFLLRHNRCANILDEEIVYQLQSAINKRCYIEITRMDGTACSKILPVAVRIDTLLGRWYLLHWSGQPCITRISNIRAVKEINTPTDDWDQITEQVRQTLADCGVAAPQSLNDPHFVEAELCFGENTGIFELFKREIRKGSIVQKENSLFYQVWIRDPNELKPFLRRYAPWLRICSGQHLLDLSIRNDLKTMRDQLGE